MRGLNRFWGKAGRAKGIDASPLVLLKAIATAATHHLPTKH